MAFAPQQDQDFQTENDAKTLMDHAALLGDKKRHKAATDHLGKKLQQTQDAHKMARKHLEKQTKGRLKKTFGGGGGSQDFGSEKEKETAEAERIVNEKD